MLDSSRFDFTVRIKEHVLFQELDGEGVLLHLEGGVYFGLDPIGTRVWMQLDDGASLSDIVDAIVSVYDVPAHRCAADVLALLSELEKHDLVELLRSDSAP